MFTASSPISMDLYHPQRHITRMSGHADWLSVMEKIDYWNTNDECFNHIDYPPKYQGRTKSWTKHMNSRFPIQENPNLHRSWKLGKGREALEEYHDKTIRTIRLTSQLRQIRSQFHRPSSYYLIYASRFLATPFSCQPLSVFIFENHENGNNKTDSYEKASMVASWLFKLIER